MRVPIDINELTVTTHYARDPKLGTTIPNAAIEVLASSTQKLREAAEALVAAHDAALADPTQTAAQRTVALRTQALKVAEVMATKIDAARARAQADYDSLAQSIHAPSVRDPALVAEIRQTLRAMKADDRRELVAKAIAGGDDDTLSAMLANVPSYLVGISDAELAARRDAWQRQRHPAAHDRLQRIHKALEAHARAATSFIGMVKGMTTGAAHELAEASVKAEVAKALIQGHLTAEV